MQESQGWLWTELRTHAERAAHLQEFGKTKLFIPPQSGAQQLSKEVRRGAQEVARLRVSGI